MIWDESYALPAGFLLAFVLPALVGFLALRFAGGLSQSLRLALSYPVGAALVFVVQALALGAGSLSLAPFLAAPIFLVLGFFGIIRGRPALRPRHTPHDALEGALLAAIVLVLFHAGARALLGTTSAPESIAGWSIKARHLQSFGLDGAYFRSSYESLSEPLFQPLQIAWIASAFNEWNDRATCLSGVLMLASSVLAIGCFLRERGHSRAATFGLVGLLVSSPSLLRASTDTVAAAPLACHAVLAAIFVHRGFAAGRREDLFFAGLFAGLAAATKIEAILLFPIVLALCAWAARQGASPWRGTAWFLLPSLPLVSWWPVVLGQHAIPLFGATATAPSPFFRAICYFLRDALASSEGTSHPDDWLLLLPATILVVVSKRAAVLQSRAWIFLVLAAALTLIAAIRVCYQASPETALAYALPLLLVPIMPLLFLALGTTLAEKAGTMESP